jgi:hypothetical protein
MTIKQIIQSKIDILPESKQAEVLIFLNSLIESQTEVVQQKGSPKQRIPDLDRGSVLSISEDFDAPLPDDFWCGVDDPVTMIPEQIQRLNTSSLGT